VQHKYFIAGTDTEVGKTFVSEVLLNAAKSFGLTSLGLKPVAAGAEEVSGNWVNEDALRLREASSENLPYSVVNPVCLQAPLSPHIAALRENKTLRVDTLQSSLQAGLEHPSDVILVEGAGGWRVPVNEDETMADLAKGLNMPVILVVGMRLGCINHALLSAEAIRNDGLQIKGWVANHIDSEMHALEENLLTLRKKLGAPQLGFIPKNANIHSSELYKQFNMLFC